MVRSAAAVSANCLKGANAKVTIQSQGPVEVMKVSADHLPTEHGLRLLRHPGAQCAVRRSPGTRVTWKATAPVTPAARSSGASASRPSPWRPAWHRLRKVFNSPPFPDASPSTRRSTRCRCTTSACGSTRPRNPPLPAVRPRPRRSTVSTTPARRRSAPPTSRTSRSTAPDPLTPDDPMEGAAAPSSAVPPTGHQPLPMGSAASPAWGDGLACTRSTVPPTSVSGGRS